MFFRRHFSFLIRQIQSNHLTFIHADADFLSGLRFVRIVVGVETPNQIAVLRMGEDETRIFGGG